MHGLPEFSCLALQHTISGPQASQATVQESMEYVESIIADVQRLGIEFKPPITYTSDYFPELLDLAERLIKAGFMYADDTPVKQMREVRTCAVLPHAGYPTAHTGTTDAPLEYSSALCV